MPTRLSVLGVRIPEQVLQRRHVVPIAVLFLTGLTLLEWCIKLDFSLGIFYTFPVVFAATVLNRTQTILFSIGCALARGTFTPASSDLEFFLKFLMASIAYGAAGLLVVEMSNNRRRILEHYAHLRMEQQARRRAEEQLQLLAESSPAAIITIDSEAKVQAANVAAHQILGFAAGSLLGQSVTALIPAFSDALQLSSRNRAIRTSVSGWAKRKDDQAFPFQAWISVYGHGESRHLAAIVVDMSEDVRERERENFQHLLDNNRVLAGAVSHEIRNLCSAIAVVCSNMRARGEWKNTPDFDALQQLVEGLSRLASFRLRQRANNQPLHVDLRSVLDQLRVVIEPDWEEMDAQVEWQIPEAIPEVAGDAHTLLQMFLNLAQNSLRAVEQTETKRLTVAVQLNHSDVMIRFIDSGRGVPNRAGLFQPFRSEADGAGLGLYISRELARSIGGDLEYVPRDQGSEFAVLVPYAVKAELKATEFLETSAGHQTISS